MDLRLATEDRQAAGDCGGPDPRHARFELRTFEDLDELEQVWLELEQRTSAPLFLSWDWIGCWVREASLPPRRADRARRRGGGTAWHRDTVGAAGLVAGHDARPSAAHDR